MTVAAWLTGVAASSGDPGAPQPQRLKIDQTSAKAAPSSWPSHQSSSSSVSVGRQAPTAEAPRSRYPFWIALAIRAEIASSSATKFRTVFGSHTSVSAETLLQGCHENPIRPAGAPCG